MNRFNKFNKGDRLSANALNSLVDSLPKYDNIMATGLYTDCGNGQVIIQNGKDKFGAVGEVGEKPVNKLYPFKVKWCSHSKTVQTSGEWQIYLPSGCVTINSQPVVPTNARATDIDGNQIKDWYKIEEPQNSDADIGTFGQYEVKEWQVYVHIKSLPLMYVSTKKEDSSFVGTINDLYVDNIMVKEWETETSEGQTIQNIQYIESQLIKEAQHLKFEETGTFRLEWKLEGQDKYNQESYKLYLVNQCVDFGRVQVWGAEKTDITSFSDVFVKIDHSKKQASISVVGESTENTLDYTFIKILKMDNGSVKDDYRETIRNGLQLYNN